MRRRFAFPPADAQIMKAYLITTGTLFAVMVVLHVWRVTTRAV
jgi:hypothetical protein